MSDTFAEAAATIKRLAEDAFCEHVIKSEGDGRWLCRKPGASSAYWFRVIVAPRSIVILGDVGECVFLCSDWDSLAWLRGSATSWDYLLSKVQASKEPPKKFYPADAVAWLREAHADELKEEAEGGPHVLVVEDAERLLRTGDLHEHSWISLMEEHSVDDAYSVGRRWSETMLWMVEVCKTFVRLHDAQQLETPVAEVTQ